VIFSTLQILQANPHRHSHCAQFAVAISRTQRSRHAAMFSAKIVSRSVSPLARASAPTAANPSEATTTCTLPSDRPSTLYYIFLSTQSSLRLCFFSITFGQAHGSVFIAWFSRSGLGRRLTSYVRSALTQGSYFCSFPSISVPFYKPTANISRRRGSICPP
jgi:hypothetical protein